MPYYPLPSFFQSTPADQTGISTVVKMLGLAASAAGSSITPLVTGRVLIQISGTISNDTAADGANAQIAWGSGAAPANGAGISGTVAGGVLKILSPAALLVKAPFHSQAIVSTMTPGTAYWVDLQVVAITGGLATVKDVSVSIIEF